MSQLSALCAAVDAEDVARHSVRRIRRMLPAYRVIDLDEHLAAVRIQQSNQLEAVAAERPVAGTALATVADLARDRARQGIEIEVLISAYHLGDQVLWQALVEAADRTTRSDLPRAASLLFASLHAISATLTAVHAEVTQALQSRRISASQRLIELLLTGSSDDEARALALALDMDPDGTFAVMVWRTEASQPAALPTGLIRRLDRVGIRFAPGHSGADDIVVCEGPGVTELAELLAPEVVKSPGWWAVGVGRPGLEGAARSLVDARLSTAVIPMRAADDTRVLAFADVWQDACVLAERDRLEPVVAAAAAVALKHPHLAEAVVAFAGADMQIARAAQTLHLHANSLSYRLDRWAALTGWSARSFEELRRSVLAIATTAPS